MAVVQLISPVRAYHLTTNTTCGGRGGEGRGGEGGEGREGRGGEVKEEKGREEKG